MFVGVKNRKANARGYVIDKDYKMFLNGMYGMAIGDALGVPYELRSRHSLDVTPCEDMTGYGSYFIPRGFWSDDTSMALATLDSLINNDFDLGDIMNNFVDWHDNGKYAIDNFVFDCEVTVEKAIENYKKGVSVYDCGIKGVCGNGSLMRILPACLYVFYEFRVKNENIDDCLDKIFKISDLTHNTLCCRMACGLYFFVVKGILDHYGTLIERVGYGLKEGLNYFSKLNEYEYEINKYSRLADINVFIKTPRNEIKSTSYVVDSIEAAIWCLIKSSSYKECVLKAVNLGDDTDTIACIAGGLAGLAYTTFGIPVDWKLIIDYDCLDDICNMADSKFEVI